MGIPARSRAVASAAVAVKGLRFAPMNAQRARALDRHPRCGCFSAMRKMSFSHVPHDQGHGGVRGASAQRGAGPAAKHAAPGRYRASVARPAVCWS